MSNQINIEALVNQAIQEFQVPGIAVGVVHQDQILVCDGFGVRDIKKNLPITKETLFPLASNTKPFTGYLMAQLVQDGKIKWDDLVTKYIPEFKLCSDELTSQVTIRDIIAHRTGIPRHDILWYHVRHVTEKDLLTTLPHMTPISGFREAWEYNNFMYVIASMILQKVTGNTWEDELSARILTPLGMKATGTHLRELQESSNFSHPYVKIGESVDEIPFLKMHSTRPASAMYSNVSDMVKWLQVQLTDTPPNGFIKGSSREDMFTRQTPDSPPTKGYGLGWQIDVHRDLKEVLHGGNSEGFHSVVSLLPEKGIGLVILTNSSTDGPPAALHIKKLIFYSLLEVEDSKNVTLDTYEGKYTNPIYGDMQITAQKDSLHAHLGNIKSSLRRQTGDVFKTKFPALLNYGVNPMVDFSFMRDSTGEIQELHVPFEKFRGTPAIIFKRTDA